MIDRVSFVTALHAGPDNLPHAQSPCLCPERRLLPAVTPAEPRSSRGPTPYGFLWAGFRAVANIAV